MNTDNQPETTKKQIPLIEPISYSIKCLNINLKSCSLNIIAKDKVEDKKLKYSIQCHVFNNLLLSELRVKTFSIISENNQFAQSSSFIIVGVFSGETETPKNVLAEFGKFSSLTILWPYAREFYQSLLQRTGFAFDCLPVINAQVMTERMIKENSILINYPPEPASENQK